ncbi:MAG: site-2 protease family protein [Clostridiales bacterium]|nr:site-2 protease family protein [Clostridiales bacterium]
MFNFSLSNILYSIKYLVPVVIIALPIHEYAHARVAYSFGDPTAKNNGRLTLNPLKHLDLVGTILLIVAQFGWAKPVPINPFFFQGNRKRKILYVSLAGPVSNLLQAIIGTTFIKLIPWLSFYSDNSISMSILRWLFTFLVFYVHLNLVLAIFNLLPMPPLDGSKILAGFLPDRYAEFICNTLERYGFIILIVLLFTGLLSLILGPPVNFLFDLLMKVFNVPINFLANIFYAL